MPPEEMLDIPGMRDELRRPMMLLVAAPAAVKGRTLPRLLYAPPAPSAAGGAAARPHPS